MRVWHRMMDQTKQKREVSCDDDTRVGPWFAFAPPMKPARLTPAVTFCDTQSSQRHSEPRFVPDSGPPFCAPVITGTRPENEP